MQMQGHVKIFNVDTSNTGKSLDYQINAYMRQYRKDNWLNIAVSEITPLYTSHSMIRNIHSKDVGVARNVNIVETVIVSFTHTDIEFAEADCTECELSIESNPISVGHIHYTVGEIFDIHIIPSLPCSKSIHIYERDKAPWLECVDGQINNRELWYDKLYEIIRGYNHIKYSRIHPDGFKNIVRKDCI